ncbi:hypothetical protein Val02_05870 [Virgisporangium aliadipatigenens]|uniref:Uncharacterized protein n=1 Tax=Virgisporangium aliadipatigenens TaxID=741659 RepID=A0A8J3YGT5_9ACTN|nr:hypothetical protein [Virgisporangium aliadipatigenens]GIJ43701.1 hypothetical protein Val02_05870 [Virgisporangium aliadipatigenens]
MTAVMPPPAREPAKPFWRRKRIRVAALLLVAAAAVPIAHWWPSGPRSDPRNPCASVSGAGLRIWSEAGDCVGVTDGSAPIDPEFNEMAGGRFGQLLDAVREENRRVDAGTVKADDGRTLCAVENKATVDVVAFAPWRHELTGSRAYNQLTGMYVAQWQANHLRQPGGCDPLIRLLIADPGKDVKAWKSVTAQVLSNPRAVAVIGFTLSRTETIEAAREFNVNGMPVVADLVTADGFDRTNFANAPATCNLKSDPSRPLDDFYRITYSNARYLEKLSKYLTAQRLLEPGAARHVTQHDYRKDSFACTNVHHVNALIKPSTLPIEFDLSMRSHDAAGQIGTKVAPMCADHSITTIFYTARALDLANLLQAAEQPCQNRELTLAAGTDATRLLTPEIDPTNEAQRRKALEILSRGKIKLFFPATSTPAQLLGTDGFRDFQRAFEGAFAAPQFRDFRLNDTQLANTWLVNAHDAFFTAANAVHALSVNGQPYTRDAVSSNLSVVSVDNAAQGNLRFGADGTRAGEPAVVRLCVDNGTPSLVAAAPERAATCPSDPPVRAAG